MATNPLKYTNLTYDDIIKDMNAIIASDPNYSKVNGSLANKLLLDMFAGVTDILNYNIQRRAEEQYMTTAKNANSVIQIARTFAYDITRPIPATATISLTIAGDISGFITAPNTYIQIPALTSFQYNGMPFLLKNTCIIAIDQTLYTEIQNKKDKFTRTFTEDSYGNPLTIIQAEQKTHVIPYDTNFQYKTTFQKYLIPDVTFSDIYGDRDYLHGQATTVRVGTANTPSDSILYTIDRKSLVSYDNILKLLGTSTSQNKICVLKTGHDNQVELLFGNGGSNGFADIGAGATGNNDNIYINYLSTNGSAGNKGNATGDTATCNGKVASPAGESLNNFSTFLLTSSVNGGGDMEDIDSIRYSTPKIFYSLDRLVSQSDYKHYLRALTSPINVRNAIAWGEQQQKGSAFADMKSNNIVYYSVLGSLYDFNSDVYDIQHDLSESVLDTNYNTNDIASQSLLNVYTLNAAVQQLKEYAVTDRYFKTLYGFSTVAKIGDLESTGSNTFAFSYTSDNSEYANEYVGTSSVQVDLGGIITESGLDTTNLATNIKNALIANTLLDDRGPATINSNYGSPMFDADSLTVTAVQNSDDSVEIVIRFDMSVSSVKCYIPKIEATAFSTALGLKLSAITDYETLNSGTISDKILTVTTNLNNKAQVTIQHIYISPMVYPYKLVGNVYVNKLVDIQDIRIECNNSLYKAFDVESDFNAEIKLSNVIQILEDNANVSYVDISIVPNVEETVNPLQQSAVQLYGLTYLYPNTTVEGPLKIIEKVLSFNSTENITAYKLYNNVLASMFKGGYETNSSGEIIDVPFTGIEAIWTSDFAQQNPSEVLTDLRAMYGSTVTIDNAEVPVTLDSINQYYSKYGTYPEVSIAFNKNILSTIYNYYNYYVILNLINSKGNVGIPDSTDLNNVKGRYSFGAEIPQITSELMYVYNS